MLFYLFIILTRYACGSFHYFELFLLHQAYQLLCRALLFTVYKLQYG